jgi:hypothetical protein
MKLKSKYFSTTKNENPPTTNPLICKLPAFLTGENVRKGKKAHAISDVSLFVPNQFYFLGALYAIRYNVPFKSSVT